MKWRWLLVLGLWLASVQPAAAEDQLDLSVRVPLEGAVKYNSWMRLEVTVTAGDQPVFGFLELGRQNFPQLSLDESIRQKLSLAKRETRQFTFDLPTEMFMNNTEIRIRQGDEVLLSEPVPRMEPRGERLVGVVNANESAFHFLAINGAAAGQGAPFVVKHLNADSLPDESWIYKNLDILALGSDEIRALNQRQVAAIKEWVRRGGVVILSAGPNQDQVVKPFEDLLSVQSGMSGNRTNLDEFRQYTGEKVLPFSDIPVYHKDLPLFLSKQAGIGVILFANYDVTAEPLASWQHNRQLWQNVLAKHQAIESMEKREDRSPVDMSLLQLSKFIPGVKTPSVGWIILIWCVYLLVVAPLLYVLLKRVKRREWAWGIIPATAILLSAGVYLIGKPQVLKEDTSFHVTALRILDDKLAEVQSAASFATVSGGDYEVVTEKGYISVPLSFTRGSMQPQGTISIQQDQDERALTFEKVPYLSVKQATATGIMSDAGSFHTNMTVKEDRLQGTVRNNTAFDLEQAYIEMGLQRIPVGTLKQGEEKQIDAKIESFYLSGDQRQPNAGPSSAEQQVERLKANALAGNIPHQIRVVGVSDKPLPIFSMRRENKAHYWNILSQLVRLQPSLDGTLIYPYGLLPVHVVATEGSLEGRSPYLWELGKGSVTYGLAAGQVHSAIKRVTVPVDHSSFRPFKREIYHAKSGQWKELPREQRVELSGNVGEYINRDGMILIRFTNTTEQRISLPTPFFQVEGEEKRS
jgi:hypothetical protein